MPANRYGIDVGEILRTKESIASSKEARKGAKIKNKLAELRLAEEERKIAQRPELEARERGRQDALSYTRGQAAAGDVDAQQRLLSLDPEGGPKFLEAIGKMDERKLEQTKRSIDEMGQMSSYVLQGKTPEEQERRYNLMYQGVSPDVQSKLPEKYDPNFMQLSLSKATTMDKILENPKAVTVGGQNILYKAGQEVERADVPEKKSTTSADGGLKSSGESLMYKQAAAYFGGMIDPVTGEMSGLLQNDVPKAQAIASEAAKIYRQKGNVSRSEAVQMAANKYGIETPEQTGQGGSTYAEGQRAKNAAGDIIVFTNGEWVKE